MSTKKKVTYVIRVEGGLVDETTSLAKARALVRKFEAEGWWNVTLTTK